MAKEKKENKRNNYYLTEEGLKKIKQDLNYLKNVKRKEISERLKEAISYGDLSENFAYQQAKEDQAFLEGKINELEKLINRASVVESKDKDKVHLGSIVTIVEISDDKKKEETFTLVSSAEADVFSGKISVDSPIGQKLLNLKEGDIFILETQNGKKEYKVIKIQ
jgi:transcription elongation factor GreA